MSLASQVSEIWSGVKTLLGLKKKLDQIIETQQLHTDLLKRILAEVETLPAVRVRFDVTLEGNTTEGANSVVLKSGQFTEVSLAFFDKNNNPAKVQSGSVAFSGPDFVTISENPAFPGDETKRIVTSNGPLGTGQVSASADADLGEGVKTITGLLDIEVIAGDAVTVQINAGPAQDAGTPPPPVPPVG